VGAHFFNNRVFHWSISNNSSGEQISGQRKPASEVVARYGVFCQAAIDAFAIRNLMQALQVMRNRCISISLVDCRRFGGGRNFDPLSTSGAFHNNAHRRFVNLKPL
jgi:hypothetical protein